MVHRGIVPHQGRVPRDGHPHGEVRPPVQEVHRPGCHFRRHDPGDERRDPEPAAKQHLVDEWHEPLRWAAGGGAGDGAGGGALEAARLQDAVRLTAPDLPEVVLEVSGTQPGLETALTIVRPKGRVALVGSQQRLDRFDLFWPLQNSGARIVPLYRDGSASVQSAVGSPTQRFVPLVHEMLLRGWLRIAPLITWVVSPEVAPRAMDLLHRRPDLAVGMAVAWDPALVRDDAAVELAWREDARSSP